MATEKKNDKERSVEERLKALYQLQTYLSEIDRIKIPVSYTHLRAHETS